MDVGFWVQGIELPKKYFTENTMVDLEFRVDEGSKIQKNTKWMNSYASGRAYSTGANLPISSMK